MSHDFTDRKSMDRDIGRAADALARYRVALARDPEPMADVDPLFAFRHVSGKNAYEAIAGSKIADPDDPARLTWVHALTEARVVRDLDVEWATCANEKAAKLEVGVPRLVSWREAWRGIVASPARSEAIGWLGAAAERGPALASIARQRAERRVEVARRLGLTHPSDGHALPMADLTVAAELLLRETNDLARQAFREARRKADIQELAVSPVDAIAIAVGRDAPEGWPAHLNERWLSELFASFARGLRIELSPLPEAIGAASFARGLQAFGYAMRRGGRTPSLSFVAASSPQFVDAHRYAWVFGSLAASPAFQKRALDLSSRVVAGQTRALARTSLFAARIAAATFLLGDPMRPVAQDRFEETTDALFGIPAPIGLAGAWPAPHDDEPARFLALMTALPLEQDLVNRFDLDWFKNPRAVAFLRARASGPARDFETPQEDEKEKGEGAPPSLDAAAAARALARRFESVLA